MSFSSLWSDALSMDSNHVGINNSSLILFPPQANSCFDWSVFLVCLFRSFSTSVRCFPNSRSSDPSRSGTLPATSPIINNQDSPGFRGCPSNCYLLPGSSCPALYELHSLLPQVPWGLVAFCYWTSESISLYKGNCCHPCRPLVCVSDLDSPESC